MGMWRAVRKLIFWSHLCAGLAAAIVVGVMCVTGVVLTYQRQMVALFDRWGVESHPPAPGAKPMAVDALIRQEREEREAAPDRITIFPGATQPVQVHLKNNSAPYVDAYTGAVIGDESIAIRRFFAAVIRWHTVLGVHGEHGRQSHEVVRAINAAFVFLVLLGVLLWIPRGWTWRQLRGILLFRWGVSGRARDFNWHNTIGIWTVIPLFVIAWTGMAMSYGWAGRITTAIVGVPNPEWQGRKGPPALAAGSSGLDDLLARAKLQSKGWKAITMKIPASESSPVDFAIDMSGYGGIGKSSALELDRAGNVVVFSPAGSDGAPARTLVRFGHTGELWGAAGQTVAGIATLGAAILVWTGIALSLHRFRVWRRR